VVAVQQGDMGAAEGQYAALESVTGIMLQWITTDRVLGLLAQTASCFASRYYGTVNFMNHKTVEAMREDATPRRPVPCHRRGCYTHREQDKEPG